MRFVPVMILGCLPVSGCSFDVSGVPLDTVDAAVDDAIAPRNEDFSVSEPGVIINNYTTLDDRPTPSGQVIIVQDTDFAEPGDLLLLWQTARRFEPEPAPGGQSPVALAEQDVGRHELRRVESVNGTTITLDSALDHPYASAGAQVVRVPWYRSLTIETTGSITARPWDGATGGIVAARVDGPLVNHGLIDVTGLGFRGGDPDGDNGHRRGEGLLLDDYNATTARTNQLNAGGAGDDHNAGGAGGGHAQPGGRGGHEFFGNLDRYGQGGAPLAYDPATHLAMGGGGGSGDANDNSAGAGGAGGGVIWLHAQSITGDGTFAAGGAPGDHAAGDGAGGGGAGGLIVLTSESALACGAATATGGDGGEADQLHGPGGGGAPGRIALSPASSACEATARFGIAGRCGSVSVHGPCHGALPCCGDHLVSGDEECDGEIDCSPTCQRQ